MIRRNVFAAAIAASLLTSGAPAFAAPTPKPSPHPTQLGVHMPNVPLHTEVVVEVNKKGQVVRVKSTKPCKVQSFNLQTYGNALQMWIRHPDGSAQVGLYRVTYDYDPKSQQVTRKVAIISPGGNWGDEPGAANVMIEMAKKQAEDAAKHEQQLQQQQNAKLPSLNEIRGVPTSRPSPSATLPP